MALMKCRGCGGQVHPAAIRCPHCGCPHPNPARHALSRVPSIVFAIIALLMLANSPACRRDQPFGGPPPEFFLHPAPGRLEWRALSQIGQRKDCESIRRPNHIVG
jgi:hypothetical protein